MFCTNCGKDIPDTAKVCGYCGTKHKPIEKVTPVPQVVQFKEETTQPQVKKKEK